MKSWVNFFIVAVCLSLVTAVKAENQSSHTHGLAQLTLALENNLLAIQLESPAMNLLGFEHKARSAKQKQAVAKTLQLLNSPNLIFKFLGAQCELTDSSVDVSGVLGDAAKRHDHHHDHHHDSKGSTDSSHSEIIASYRFSCKDTKNLHTVTVALFEQFPRIETINAIWLTDTQQGSKLLKPSRNAFSFR